MTTLILLFVVFLIIVSISLFIYVMRMILISAPLIREKAEFDEGLDSWTGIRIKYEELCDFLKERNFTLVQESDYIEASTDSRIVQYVRFPDPANVKDTSKKANVPVEKLREIGMSLGVSPEDIKIYISSKWLV